MRKELIPAEKEECAASGKRTLHSDPDHALIELLRVDG